MPTVGLFLNNNKKVDSFPCSCPIIWCGHPKKVRLKDDGARSPHELHSWAWIGTLVFLVLTQHSNLPFLKLGGYWTPNHHQPQPAWPIGRTDGNCSIATSQGWERQFGKACSDHYTASFGEELIYYPFRKCFFCMETVFPEHSTLGLQCLVHRFINWKIGEGKC